MGRSRRRGAIEQALRTAEGHDQPLQALRGLHADGMLKQMVDAVSWGMQAHPPKLIEDGMGGSYLLTDDRGTPQAILKPCDEEPLAPNNPKVRPRSQRVERGD